MTQRPDIVQILHKIFDQISLNDGNGSVNIRSNGISIIGFTVNRDVYNPRITLHVKIQIFDRRVNSEAYLDQEMLEEGTFEDLEQHVLRAVRTMVIDTFRLFLDERLMYQGVPAKHHTYPEETQAALRLGAHIEDFFK